MRKVSVIVTARASYCRVLTLLHAIAAHTSLYLQLVVFCDKTHPDSSSMKYRVQRDGFEMAGCVEIDTACNDLGSAAIRTAHAIKQLVAVFTRLAPDIVITIADRHETMATAIAASYLNIPLAHLQGGEVTGNIDDKVRNAITRLADVHFVATRQAKIRLVRSGEDQAKVHWVGCPAIDLAHQIVSNTDESIHDFKGIHFPFASERFLIVMQHAVTTEFGEAHCQVKQTLEAVRQLNMPVLWFKPNYDPGHCDLSGMIPSSLDDDFGNCLHIMQDLSPQSFLRLLNQSACLIGNSSAGIREASFLGIPAVNIGSRQAGRERAHNVVDVDYQASVITKAASEQLKVGRYQPSYLYGNGNAASQIADLLATCPLSIIKKNTF
ncbi:UDP-N-acetylglucosamine 2-epimerase [Dyadobacter sandarakinus]|uniref:UDP-N-acetylglucosamine 2-epimerase (Hydrolyzing) n=1 Tax=Dyadobacter sandarakinus TaxID=2747268 RepID=A0ABX7IAU6_9BACT|nr:UDP-N-acetylglucosamine 2-epimerase [Dyadobacter sandarakinus]QRR03242.1 UDP-N-acetylglucosamine 2-epimerase (hydrolyzing) [Dyadobacter sandarakinus]